MLLVLTLGRPSQVAGAQWTDQPAQPGWQADQLEAHLAAYKDRLARIAGLIERMGAVPVFVTQTRADYSRPAGWRMVD